MALRAIIICSLLSLSLVALTNGVLPVGAQGTTIEVGDATLYVGESTSVSVWVRDFPEDGYGLGAYTISITYDPTMIDVTSVSPGVAPFDAPIYGILDDKVGLTDFAAVLLGPTGTTIIANLEFTCLRAGETTLVPTITFLANTNGDEIIATAVSGTITQVHQVTPTPTPTPTITLPPPTSTPVSASGELDLTGSMDENYVTLEALGLISGDGMVELSIPRGTTVLTAQRMPLETMVVQAAEELPVAKAARVVGLAYDFGPDGATFDPSLTITLKYSLDWLSEGIAEENLVIGYLDLETGNWVELDSVVDPTTHTVTAQVSHFTPFAILVRIEPATFALTDLDISPTSPDPGQEVTISALVTNIGGLTSTYAVPLKINDTTEDTQEVRLDPGSSQMVSFSVTAGDPGKYDIEIGPLTNEFEVDGTGTGSGWITPIVIILAVVVAILAAILLVRWAHRRPLSRL